MGVCVVAVRDGERGGALKATSAVRAIGIGRAVTGVSMSGSFRLCEGQDDRRPPEEARGGERPTASIVGREREAVDWLRLWVEHGHAGRDREQVAHEQAEQDCRRAREHPRACRAQRQPDDERSEQNGRGGEAEAGADALVEVGETRAPWMPALIAQATMTTSRLEPEQAHRTITVPFMSRLCSVQTYSNVPGSSNASATLSPCSTL